MKLEVDFFEVDARTLHDARSIRSHRLVREAASCLIVETVIKNLTPESKREFEEYAEQENPCRSHP